MKAFEKKTIAEKVSYISALVDQLPKEDATAKILELVVTTLEDVSGAIAGLKEDTEYLDAYIEEVDEDLGALEEDLYCDDEDDCCCDDDCDCCCDCDDDEFVEVECPNCGEKVCLDDTVDFDCVTCPACGEEFSCTCDCCEDDDDCGCCCCHDED